MRQAAITKENEKVYGTFEGIIDQPQNYYIMSEDDPKQFSSLDNFRTAATTGWISTTKGIIQCNHSLAIEKWFPNIQVNTVLGGYKNIKLIRRMPLDEEKAKQDKTGALKLANLKFLDSINENKLVGEIETSAEVFIHRTNLFLWGKNAFIIQPLDALYARFCKETIAESKEPEMNTQ
jgi:hypothetical protein